MNKLLYITLFLNFVVLQITFGQKIKNDSLPENALELKYKFDYNKEGNLYLNNPTDEEVIYKPEVGKYIVRKRIGNSNFSTPKYYTIDEYRDYRLQKSIKEYFKTKNDAVLGRSEKAKAEQKNLLPKYYVNNSFFKNIFGGSEINITPRGSLTLNIGLLYQNVDNPLLSEDNRKSYTPQFEQQIRASLTAKIGERLSSEINFDTQSTFNFQNQVNLEYIANEDDIIQELEAGNVTMDINNNLIQGSQSLFGFKTKLKFGKTTITSVIAQQQSQTKNVSAQGGSALSEFELRTTSYDANRHFFLSQYFRNNYNQALAQLPLINSSVQITKVEVWVTNRNRNTEDVRNIVGLVDLGESGTGTGEYSSDNNITSQTQGAIMENGPIEGRFLSRNEANNLNRFIGTQTLRNVANIPVALAGFQAGTDYSIIENARKLNDNEYTFHPQLGYISLQNRLTDGDVLAVAFEYTVNGQAYRVGELSTDGISSEDTSVVKLIRSEIINTQAPMWRLMMKNIYSLGAYQLETEGFRFDIVYRDDVSGQAVNNLLRAKTITTNGGQHPINERTILNLTNLDRLDPNGNRTKKLLTDENNRRVEVFKGDGFFDYINGITINSRDGTIIFPSIEPFGRDMKEILTDPLDENFIFEEMYTTTPSVAQTTYQNKDKYILKGFYKASGSEGISLGAFNVPRGSVTVTAGGITLTEGVDYTVDYLGGRVNIINPAIEASNQAINVSLENNSFFNQQRKVFFGIDVEHKVNEKFVLGATFLNIKEQPLTNKVQFGQDPINNTMLGFNTNFSTKANFLTAAVNRLPNIDTDAESNISFRGDIAVLRPNTPDDIDIGGEATTYIDDFEGAQIPINLGTPRSWALASLPNSFNGRNFAATDNGNTPKLDSLNTGKKRAKLSWYTIDQLFLFNSSLKPANIDDQAVSRASTRPVQNRELFPQRELDATQRQNIQTFDLTYYPNERGPYNYNVTDLNDPTKLEGNVAENWGGITRALTTTDFQRSNVQYLEFWLQDPYEHYDINNNQDKAIIANGFQPNNENGSLYINLGSISEDILQDGRKSFENGFPEIKDPSKLESSVWGNIPTEKSLLYAFGQGDGARLNQDIGLDGLNDDEEKTEFKLDIPDPSADNFRFFRGQELDIENASILRRYKDFNNPEGNSNTAGLSPESFPTSATNDPDTEDVNRDQTMNTINAYWQYKIDLSQNALNPSNKYIVDQRTTRVTLENGTEQDFTWYQFRVPINNPDNTPNIPEPSLQSIRFMRMFLTDFEIPINLRFAEMQLVRGDWRIFDNVIDGNFEEERINNLNIIETGVVNVEENENRVPINYILPPTITRESLRGTSNVLQQNEQSLSVIVKDLEPNKTVGVFKNLNVDLRMFERLKMFIHAEQLNNNAQLNNGDLVAVVRLGSDSNDNFYQVEIPLTKTEVQNLTINNALNATAVWPEENNLNIDLRELTKAKLERDQLKFTANEIYTYGKNTNIKIKGSPNLSNVRTVFLGVKNINQTANRSTEVWFNELRLAGFDNQGGWATKASLDANIADFATVSANAGYQSIGFGGINQSINERSQEEIKGYSATTSINAGQLLPEKWNIKIPVSYSVTEEIRTPKFDPKYEDVRSEDAKDQNDNSDYIDTKTKQTSISFLNVKKDYSDDYDKSPKIYDIENFSVSYAYSENNRESYTIEKDEQQTLNAGATYNFKFKQIPVTPFKKLKLNKKYFSLIKDFNFNLLPTSIGVNSNLNRNFSTYRTRDVVNTAENNINIPTLTQRNFLFNWDYNLNYQLTKSLNFSFNASNNHIYDEFQGDDFDDEELEQINLYSNLLNFGRINSYNHTLNANYKIPINKLPFMRFISSDYSYNASFNFDAASIDYVKQVGNTINNSASHALNTTLNFSKFYKDIGLTKLLKPKRRSRSLPKVGNKKKKKGFSAKSFAYNLVTSVKTLKVNYTQNTSSLLNGYAPSVGFLGRQKTANGSYAPGIRYLFGDNRNILSGAAANDWLTPSSDGNSFNKSYNRTEFKSLDYNLTVKPIKDLNIQFTGNVSFADNSTQQVNYVENSNGRGTLEEGLINQTGNFNISYSLIKTAISSDPEALFNQFRRNRSAFVDQSTLNTQLALIQNDNSPQAIEKRELLNNQAINSQGVLLSSFLAAYSGSDANNFNTSVFRKIPIPNWKLTYRGLMKVNWFKKRFSNFLVSHGYESSYTINNFSNNLRSQSNEANPFQSSLIFSGVTLVDNFNPLVKIDVKLKNSLSFRGTVNRNRTLSLNLNNTSLSETIGGEFIFGLGYRFKDVKLKTRFNGKRKTLKGDINVKADLSLRAEENVIRSIDTGTTQIVGGQNIFGIKLSADYNLSRNFTASFYYDQNATSYSISTQFPRQSINAGISLLYNLGN